MAGQDFFPALADRHTNIVRHIVEAKVFDPRRLEGHPAKAIVGHLDAGDAAFDPCGPQFVGRIGAATRAVRPAPNANPPAISKTLAASAISQPGPRSMRQTTMSAARAATASEAQNGTTKGS